MAHKHTDVVETHQVGESTFEVSDKKQSPGRRLAALFGIKSQERRISRERKEYQTTSQMQVPKLYNPGEAPAAEPKEPSPESIIGLVKGHLEEGKSITVLDCLRLFHSTELRYAIAKLRKNMTIKDEWETHNGRRYKRYFL